MKINFYWNQYKYLPYERRLAERELRALLGHEPTYTEGGLFIENLSGWESYAQRTTYFREVVAADGSRVVPLQTILEASTRRNRQPTLFDDVLEKLPNADVLSMHDEVNTYRPLNRQSTRYSAHGLHEYRGKFNPQIVRAIGNMLGLQLGDWLLDPFCGSGTTVLEAAHIGWNAIGIDINPLGVQIARAKIAAMHVSPQNLRTNAETLSRRLRERFKDISFEQAFTEKQARSLGGINWQSSLPSFDYLSSWFTDSVLVQLSVILDEIAQVQSEDIQLIFRVILSDIIREVSLQDPGDLRIRRRKSPPENMPAILLYIRDLTSKIDIILKARKYVSHIMTLQDALLGDSRDCVSVVRSYPTIDNSLQFNAAITSPPYATALPYIDTQRLSLVLFGLIGQDEIRIMERKLTGNREITHQERLNLEGAIDANIDHLPDECVRLCKKLKDAVDREKDGFRRQNVAALLYQYLVDMSLMFENTHSLLRANAPFALVVGTNQTRLGGQTFIIDTPHLLILLAEQKGFVLQETLELNTYQRFDIHQGNSIRSETLIILRKVEHADRTHSTS